MYQNPATLAALSYLYLPGNMPCIVSNGDPPTGAAEIWAGFVPQREGVFFFPALRKPGSTPQSKWGKGVGSSGITGCSCLWAESDTRTLDEQRAALAVFPFPPSMTMHSGGKSVHAYWGLTAELPVGSPIWQELMVLLCGLLAGDPAVCSMARKMRLPGVQHGSRIQAVETTNPVRYDAHELLGGLRKLAAEQGLDVSVKPAKPARKPGKGTAGNYRTIKADDVFTFNLRDGSPQLLHAVSGEDWRECNCPNEAAHETPDCARYRQQSDGRPIVQCNACCITWIGTEVDPLFPVIKPLVAAKADATKWVTHTRGELAGCEVMYVQAPKGSGKTTALSEVIAYGDSIGVNTLIVTHRQTLANYIALDLGVVNYQDVKGELGGKSTVVCLDSIARVKQGRYIIVVDESEQFGYHSTGATIKDKPLTWALLGCLFAVSPLIVMQDADLGIYTQTYTRALRGKTSGEFFKRMPLLERRPAVKYASFVELDVALLAAVAAGDRVAVACTSLRQTYRVVEMLSLPPDHILLINADTSGETLPFLSDPDTYLAEHPEVQVLVYSPSMGTGVSIAVQDHFQARFGYVTPGAHTTPEESDQMLARVRYPSDKRFHYAIGKGAPTSNLTTPEEVMAELVSDMKGGRAKRRVYRPELLPGVDEAGNLVWSPSHQAFAAHYALTVATRNRKSAGFAIRFARRFDNDTPDSPSESVVDQRKLDRDLEDDAAKSKRVLAILNAPILPREQAERAAQETGSTCEARMSAHRAYYQDQVPVGLDADLVEDMAYGPLVEQLKNRACALGIADPAQHSKLGLQAEQAERIGRSDRLLKVDLLVKVLGGLGFTVGVPGFFPVPSLEALLAVRAVEAELARYGIKLPPCFEERPYATLKRLLKVFGDHLDVIKTVKKTSDRKSVKVTLGYQVDGVKCARLNTLATRKIGETVTTFDESEGIFEP